FPAASLPAATAPQTLPASPARAAAQNAIEQMLSVLRDSTLSTGEKNERVKTIAQEHIDFYTFSLLALGPTWRELTENQQAQFLAEFKRHVLFICTQGTDQYKDEDVLVTADRQESPTD